MALRRRVLAAGFGALVVLFAFAGPAFAHATLQNSTPSNGSNVATSPSEVVLAFDERVEVSLGGIRVYDAKGTRVDHGTISHPNGVGSQVAIALPKLKD